MGECGWVWYLEGGGVRELVRNFSIVWLLGMFGEGGSVMDYCYWELICCIEFVMNWGCLSGEKLGGEG